MDSFVGSDDEPDVGRARPPKRPRGDHIRLKAVALVTSDDHECHHEPVEAATRLEGFGLPRLGAGRILGIALVSWDVTALTDMTDTDDHEIAHSIAACRRKNLRSTCTLFLDYTIEEAWWSPERPIFGPRAMEEELTKCPIASSVDFTCAVWVLVAGALIANRMKIVRSLALDLLTKRLHGGFKDWPTFCMLGPCLESLEREQPLHHRSIAVNVLEDAQHGIRFVRASQHIRQQKKIKAAIVDIVHSIWPAAEVPVDAVASRNFLRKARVRFDITMCLVMRAVWDWIEAYELDPMIFLFIDGSPTSGYEALICAELYGGSAMKWNRLLVITFLAFGWMSLTAKAFGMLWKMYLETGPDVSKMRWKLARIFGIVSDGGTESHLADLKDCLPEFFMYIGSVIVVAREQWLLPNCVWASGWHHKLDNIMQDVLESLPFWNAWFLDLRYAIKFLRINTYRKILRKSADNNDWDGLHLKKKPPGFIKQRWSTLRNGLFAWLEIRNILADDDVWREDLFKKARQGKAASKSRAILRCDLHFKQARIVFDVVSDIHELRVWASGCACHEADRKKGKPVECFEQGRRLPEVIERVEKFKQHCSAAARDGPCQGHACFGVDLGALEQHRVYAYDRVVAQGEVHWESYYNQPLCLARVSSVDDLRTELERWESLPEPLRHRTADALFDPSRPGRYYVNESIRCGELHMFVNQKLNHIKKLPLTEEKAEGPHATMTRDADRAPSMTRPNKAGSTRLNAQLKFYDALDKEFQDQFAVEWPRFSRVLQVDPRRQWRPVALKFEAVCAKVYEADGEGYTGPMVQSHKVANTATESSTYSILIKADWLRSVLQDKCFYTIGDERPLKAFQVLWTIPPRGQIVPHSGSRPRGVLDMKVADLGIWNEAGAFASGGGFPAKLEVFTRPDYAWVDVYRCADWQVLHKALRQWTEEGEPSDAFRFRSLGNPRNVLSLDPTELSRPSAPLLPILMLLLRRGWVKQSEATPLVVLTSPFAGVFSVAMMTKRVKAYFQVLLVIDVLFNKGLTRLTHAAPASYYSALLRSEHPEALKTNEKKAVYDALIQETEPIYARAEHDDGFIGSDDNGLASDIESHGEDDDDGNGDDLGPGAVDPDDGFVGSGDEHTCELEEPRTPSSSASVSSNDSTSGSGFVGSDVDEPQEAFRLLRLPDFPFAFDGVRFRLEDFRHKSHPDRKVASLVASCKSKHHACARRRALTDSHKALYGEWEPLAWCLAWARLGREHSSKALHMRVEPSMDHIRIAMDDLRVHYG
jgi:hypothetical protein